MADITVAGQCYTYEVSTTEREIALDPTRLYLVYHTGQDSAASASTVSVFLQCDGNAVDADNSDAEGKLVLTSSVGLPLPPGISSVKAKTASGAVTLIFLPGFKNPLELIK